MYGTDVPKPALTVGSLRAQARASLQQLQPQGGGRKRNLEPAAAGAPTAAQAPPRQRMRLAAGARPASLASPPCLAFCPASLALCMMGLACPAGVMSCS